MNLALHGFLLQVILSTFNYQYGFQLCSAGEPGYLDFDNLPETNFSCQGKVIGGYYADVEAGCQMFHVCTIGQKDEIMDIKFLCLNGTVFDQETRVCERVDEVDCSKSERFYNLNLELYGNNAVTLSLHEGEEETDESPILIEDHQGTTSTRPNTITTTTTTTQRPAVISTTAASGPYQHPSGYPQHYQPQPPFPSIQTSQSKSLYDDKNGGYHRQYIYHIENNNEQNNANQDDNRATSYQIFSNQGQSSTTGAPQIHQIHYSSTPNPSTVSPIFHATSSTIQTLLSGNNPTLINPIFHNNGISSTTEHYNVHSNTPRETTNYQQNHNSGDGSRHHADNHQNERQFLTPIQAASQGKISKLTISPVPSQHEIERRKQQSAENIQSSSQSQHSLEHQHQNQQYQKQKQQQQQQQQHRISESFLSIASGGNGAPTVRSFYPTPKASSKSQSSTTTHITQHIHIIPPFTIPQLKPHQVTINLPPPDIQRIVQNPSPLLPTQSRVIVTAKASVSDESGRPLNTTQLVTLPLPTVPASYDDYKEGDESFDPFYRDVPKIRNTRRSYGGGLLFLGEPRKKRAIRSERNVDVKEEVKSLETIDAVEDSQEISVTTADNSEESVLDFTTDGGKLTSYETTTQIPEDEVQYDNSGVTAEREILDDNVTEIYSNEQRNDDTLNDELSFEDEDFEYENESGEFKNNYNNNGFLSYDEYSEALTETYNSSEIETGTQLVDSHETTGSVENNETTQSIENNETTQSIEINETTQSVENNETTQSIENDVTTQSVENTETTQSSVVTDDEDSGAIEVESDVTTVNPMTSQIPSTTLSENVTNDYDDSEANNKREDLTEGILIFTDEIPQTQVGEESPEIYKDGDSDERDESMSVHSNPLDYVDDNYEPENYHEEKFVEPLPDNEKKMLLNNQMNESLADDGYNSATTLTDTTSVETSTSPTSTTHSTTFSSTIPTTPSTTTSTMTPRTKPTTIKLFKSMTTRRNYVYIPPTTTSVPVKIKSRLSLYNPKPAKPPKSYNELAPKPVIRKIYLNARRASSTAPIRNSLNDVSEFTTRYSTETTLANNQFLATTTVEPSMMASSSEQNKEDTTARFNGVSSATTALNEVDGVSDKNTVNDSQSTEKIIDLVIVTPETPHSTTNSYDNTETGSSTFATMQPINRKSVSIFKRNNAFICPKDLESKRFYADKRDCRLFHYCSYGYSTHQILDFRFVCEEGTVFDEETQSCVSHTENSNCIKRIW